MTEVDKVKRFTTLTLSPNVLTQPEIDALYDISRHTSKDNKLSFLIGSHKFLNTDPSIYAPSAFSRHIYIPRHIVGTLERRKVLKRQYRITKHTGGYLADQTEVYTWDIVWKKVRTKFFNQLKELMFQKALGTL